MPVQISIPPLRQADERVILLVGKDDQQETSIGQNIFRSSTQSAHVLGDLFVGEVFHPLKWMGAWKMRCATGSNPEGRW